MTSWSYIAAWVPLAIITLIAGASHPWFLLLPLALLSYLTILTFGLHKPKPTPGSVWTLWKYVDALVIKTSRYGVQYVYLTDSGSISTWCVHYRGLMNFKQLYSPYKGKVQLNLTSEDYRKLDFSDEVLRQLAKKVLA